jgi:hypothetical protein
MEIINGIFKSTFLRYIFLISCFFFLLIMCYDPEPAYKAPPTQAELEFERVRHRFAGGRHTNTVAIVKKAMHNPSSFEHVSTRYVIGDDMSLIIFMTYRGTNAFGAIVTNEVKAAFDSRDNLIYIE